MKHTVRAPRLVAIGGGKGGVGKTFLCANLSVALARSGYRVVSVDTDLEGLAIVGHCRSDEIVAGRGRRGHLRHRCRLGLGRRGPRPGRPRAGRG